MWILYAVISMMLYALAEVLQKKGSDINEEYSELKLLVWFGIISGFFSFAILLLDLKESPATALQIIANNHAVLLSPALYYLSLLLCFLAFKLVPVSIASPITCMEGIFSFIGIIILYSAIGKDSVLAESITSLKVFIVVLLSVGIYACTLIQSRKEDKSENLKLAKEKFFIKSGRFAIIGVAMTLLSAMFDAGSSLTDLYFLGEMSDSYDYIYTHGMIVLVFSAVLYLILWLLERKPYNLFKKSELPKVIGSGFDSLGTVFFMIAAAENQVFTNVLISGFCVFTVLLSRLILKETIEKHQAVWIGFTITLIVVFTVVDEMF